MDRAEVNHLQSLETVENGAKRGSIPDTFIQKNLAT